MARRAIGDVGRDSDAMLLVQERGTHLGYYHHLHVRARRTIVRGEESLLWILAAEAMKNSNFRRNDELVCIRDPRT
jgi:hypothetical protein